MGVAVSLLKGIAGDGGIRSCGGRSGVVGTGIVLLAGLPGVETSSSTTGSSGAAFGS